MCGACRVLNSGPDWVDRDGNPECVSHRPDLICTAERQRRIALVTCCFTHDCNSWISEVL